MKSSITAKILGMGLFFVFCFILPAGQSFARNIQCVWGVDAANVRTGPGMNNEVLFIAWRYEPLTVKQIKGKWAEVAEHYRYTDDEEGQKLKKGLIDKVKTGEKPVGEQPEVNTGWIHTKLLKRARCAQVRTEFLNFRTGPGVSFKTAWTLQWGYSLKYLGQRNGWYKLTDGKSTGWVHSGYVWSPWL